MRRVNLRERFEPEAVIDVATLTGACVMRWVIILLV